LASALDVPLATVRFDAVVSSYLGETAANLRRVFDFIGKHELVVLFDEFDAIGKDRDDPVEHGELKRVVNSLLQLIDASKTQSVLIAATNHELLLDSAVWRRFDAVLEFRLPSHQERILLLRLFLRGFSGSVRPESLAKHLVGATGADIERVCLAAARTAVLNGRTTVETGDFVEPMTELRERLHLEHRSLNRGKGKSKRSNSGTQTESEWPAT
jgi:SpoVK/Ycf46/Vps4 family AAA+-type ATPase